MHLSLVEFSYNNSFHSSIGMTPYKALYRKCRALYVGQKHVKVIVVELVDEATNKIRLSGDRLKDV